MTSRVWFEDEKQQIWITVSLSFYIYIYEKKHINLNSQPKVKGVKTIKYLKN